jgi:hypothetical protein
MTNKTAVTSSTTSSNTAGTDPQPAVVTPEQVVEQLRAVRASLGELTSLTHAERKRLSRDMNPSIDVLHAQINMIGAADEVAAAIGVPAGEVKALADNSGSWTAVEDELRVMLTAVESRNLVKRRELHDLTSRATNIGAQLARDPEHAAVLGTHIQEIRRLKRLGRRKKPAKPQTPGNPAPSTDKGIRTE